MFRTSVQTCVIMHTFRPHFQNAPHQKSHMPSLRSAEETARISTYRGPYIHGEAVIGKQGMAVKPSGQTQERENSRSTRLSQQARRGSWRGSASSWYGGETAPERGFCVIYVGIL